MIRPTFRGGQAPGGSRRLDRLLLALPLAATAAVYWPLTLNYFYADDFLNLYRIVNRPALEYLVTPHGGHVLVFRNGLFWLFFRAFGTDVSLYFLAVLLTHLLNVFLLFDAIRRFARSSALASFGATLWGTSAVQEGSLGWYAVYGHVTAATALLLVLASAGRLAQRGEAPGRGLRLGWYALALAAATSFGVGIGIALVLPAALALLLPAARGRGIRRLPLVSLFAVVPALYVLVHLSYRAVSGDTLHTETFARTYLQHWHAVGPMLLHLLSYGLTQLSLGSLYEPARYPDLASATVTGLAAAAALAAVLRRRAQNRERLAAFLLLTVACYGMIALGRASLFEFVGPFGVGVRRAAWEARYHYAALAPLTLFLCCALAPLGRSFGERGLAALLAVWIGALVAGQSIAAPRIDHHDAARDETRDVLARIRRTAAAAPPGETVRIANRRFRAIGSLVPRTQFPAWAGVFSIFFADNVLDGRRVTFVEPAAEVIAAAERGRRTRGLLVPPLPAGR